MSNTLIGASVFPEESKLVKSHPPSLVEKIAHRFSVEPTKMLATLKATAFKQSADKQTGIIPEVTNEQMMALLVVADQYGLNPFTREIYAFYDSKRGGIVPIVGVDGWSRIINEQSNFDGMTFHAEIDEKSEKPLSVTCTMYRKDRKHPTVVTEFYRECKRDTGPWNSHPTRMLRHKSMIQCARIAFGFVGIYDEDEGERIIEGTHTVGSSAAIDELNATIKDIGRQGLDAEFMTAKPPEPVPQTVIAKGGKTTEKETSYSDLVTEHLAEREASEVLQLTGGPNLTDIVSALRAAKTMDEVDAAEDLSRHMKLSDEQRAQVKAEAQTAEKRIANS